MATADEAMAEARHARLIAEQCAHTCERLEERSREDYATLAAKLDQVGKDVRADVGKVHGRVDQLHYWAIGTVVSLAVAAFSLAGYLLKDGPPWKTPIASIVSSAQAGEGDKP